MTARKQTRRTISISAATYDRLRAHCEAHGIAMSRWLEDEVKKMTPAAPDPRRPRPGG